MMDRIQVCSLAISLLHEVTVSKACVLQDGGKGIAMCTLDSVTGSSVLLATFYISVNMCVCAIEANSGQVVIANTGQPTSSDCGTRTDIANNNISISTTFQCKRPKLYQTIGFSISSGEITLQKQSNSTEDDLRYCLSFTGPEITITCYGTNSPPPTTTTTETTSTTTVRSLRTSTTTKAPTTTAIITTPPTTTRQQPPATSTPKSRDVTSKPTPVLTLGTTRHQGDNTTVTVVCRKDRDFDIAVIIASTLGVLCVITMVIIIFFVCRRYIRNASKKQMETDERNNNYANLSNRTEEDSNYAELNNIQIIPVPVESVMYQNVTF